jgi:predicted XRE-type DNA-binding protein
MSEVESVFRILGEPDAAVREVKGTLAVAIIRRVKARGLTQQAAADAMGIPRSEVNRIMNGRFSRFTIDRLVTALLALDPEVEVRMAIAPSDAAMATVNVAP